MADDEFNLRILELDTPLENTATLKNFINDNGLLAGRYLTTIMWDRDVVDKARSPMCFLTISSSFCRS